MTPPEVGLADTVVLMVQIGIGMPVSVAMLRTSFGGVSLIRNDGVALRVAGSVAHDSLLEYRRAVVPLPMPLWLLVTVSGGGRDPFDLFRRALGCIRAGLGFATITGFAIATASVLSRVAGPEMVRHGDTRGFATGVVAGSSVLGMRIPRSLPRIVHAVMAEDAVGRMIRAGLIPGLVPAGLFPAAIFRMATFGPGSACAVPDTVPDAAPIGHGAVLRKAIPVVLRITLVLGGSCGGFPNLTEAGAVGAAGAVAIAALRRTPTGRVPWRLPSGTGQITVTMLNLIMAVAFLSRMLALFGLPATLADTLLSDPSARGGSFSRTSRCSSCRAFSSTAS